MLQWNEEALACIRATKPGPTVVARALYILHAATYDAWAAYDREAVPTVRDGCTRRGRQQRTLANKSQAVSRAAYVTLRDLFSDPGCQREFDERLDGLGFTPGDTARAAKDGRRAGRAVVDARRHDGANQANDYADTSGYEPVNTPDRIVDPWRWQPLCVPLDRPGTGTCEETGGRPQQPLTPHWGDVEPFDPDTPEEAEQIDEPERTYEDTIGDILTQSANLDDRKRVIAEYWADGPRSELPPGHWNLFAQWVSRRWQQSIDDDAKLMLALNGAMLDSSIGAWDAKYRYDFARPVTTIPALLGDRRVRAWGGPNQGTQTIAARDWIPYQPVDFPHPAVPRGHLRAQHLQPRRRRRTEGLRRVAGTRRRHLRRERRDHRRNAGCRGRCARVAGHPAVAQLPRRGR